MTKKDCSLPHKKASAMNSKTQGKRSRKDLQQTDPGTSVGVSQDNSITDGRIKDKGAPKPNTLYTFLVHAFWAVFAWLLVMYAVNDFKFTSTTKPESSESLAREKNNAATFPTSYSQKTGSSSSRTSSGAEIVKACMLSSQNQSLIKIVSSACACLVVSSTVNVGLENVTVVCKSPRRKSQ